MRRGNKTKSVENFIPKMFQMFLLPKMFYQMLFLLQRPTSTPSSTSAFRWFGERLMDFLCNALNLAVSTESLFPELP